MAPVHKSTDQLLEEERYRGDIKTDRAVDKMNVEDLFHPTTTKNQETSKLQWISSNSVLLFTIVGIILIVTLILLFAL